MGFPILRVCFTTITQSSRGNNELLFYVKLCSLIPLFGGLFIFITGVSLNSFMLTSSLNSYLTRILLYFRFFEIDPATAVVFTNTNKDCIWRRD